MAGIRNAKALPIGTLESLLMAIRRRFFAVSRGESVTIVVDGRYGEIDGGDVMDLPLIRDVLAPAGFTGPWTLSYHYEGEDISLTRFWYDTESDLPFRQDHLRLFLEEYPPGEIGIAVHTEASPLAHPEEHLAEETFSKIQGQDRLETVFEDWGVSYRRPA